MASFDKASSSFDKASSSLEEEESVDYDALADQLTSVSQRAADSRPNPSSPGSSVVIKGVPGMF